MSANPFRDLAWRTRRERYGVHGHAGSYSRSTGECRHCRRMADVLIRLLNEGVLSEGQVAKATGRDRVAIRKRADGQGHRMTPHMIRALSAAEEAKPHRGLEYTVAGWQSTHPRATPLEYHPFQTVNALVAHGHLQLWGKGKAAVAHITEPGEVALERWRERQQKRSAS